MKTVLYCLGNPGNLSKTRHSIGLMFADYLASARFTDCKVIKSKMHMNESGRDIRQLRDCLMLAAADDLDSPFGKITIKTSPSAKGHNGLKSLIKETNGKNVVLYKLFIGIDRPASKDPDIVSQYVLSKFNRAEMRDLDELVFPQAAKILSQHIREWHASQTSNNASL